MSYLDTLATVLKGITEGTLSASDIVEAAELHLAPMDLDYCAGVLRAAADTYATRREWE
jgi:hypothetical protein